jgi:tRNA 2-selenouridine synthase
VSVLYVAAAELVDRLAEFDTIIDARSESEYAEDRLPGAANWPSLDDDQRREVGTIYKQVSPFEARKRGASLVAANIARHVEQRVMPHPKAWKPLVYCWRGGQRSGALALVLGQIGFRVHVVEGGYKAFRGVVLQELPKFANRLRFQVICGPTGSGKTRLLHALRDAGAQVLDLEGLASHRSSVLGVIPGQPQPSQKHFETLLWGQLRQFEPHRPVFVESESRKVGNLAVPDGLIGAMRLSPCLRVDLAEDERVRLLMEDYEFLVREEALFLQRLAALTQLRGKAQVEAWQAAARAGRHEEVVRELLVRHYDPGYASSTARNFTQFPLAEALVPRDRSPEAMAELARALVRLPAKQAA